MASIKNTLKWRSIGRHFFLVSILGFVSGLPFSLLGSTLSAWFSSYGVGVATIGLLSMLQQPYVFKFFWAPLVDVSFCRCLDRRRAWIMLCQCVIAIGLLLFAYLSPSHHAGLIAMIAFVMVIASATSDIAIDAFRAEMLLPKERGLGATLAIVGFRIATLVSGALALIVADYYGFAPTFMMLALLMVPCCLLVLLFKAEAHESAPIEKSRDFRLWPMIKVFLTCKEGFYTILFVLLFKLGEAFTSTSSVLVIPFLQQGLGFSLTAIGVIGKGVAIMATLTGSFVAGLILMKFSLYRSLFVFALMQVVMNSLFVVLAYVGKNYTLLTACMFLENIVAGMGMTALVAFMMGVCDKKYTATQYALLAAISALPRTFAGPIGGVIQSYLGWSNLFIIATLLAIPALFALRPLKALIDMMDAENV